MYPLIIYPLAPSEMGRVLSEVREIAEWVTAVEEVVHEEISHFSGVPDPALPDDQE